MQKVTFAQLMEKMVRTTEVIHVSPADGLTKCAVEVQKTAIKKFGKYQPTSGPYNAWAQLAAATIAQKQRAGAGGDDPLIGHRTGNSKSVYPTPLRQSIQIHVDHEKLVAQVGTNDPVGEWQEFGTSRGIPPRPFLRPALYENEEFIKKTLKAAIGKGLLEALR